MSLSRRNFIKAVACGIGAAVLPVEIIKPGSPEISDSANKYYSEIIDAVRFMFWGGDITSGKIFLYGIRQMEHDVIHGTSKIMGVPRGLLSG